VFSMLFDVKVGVNKDGHEVYRVEAESIEDAVGKAQAVADGGDSDAFELVGEDGMSSLTVNWEDVTASDVTAVPPPDPARVVTIRYTNYRGETADRKIVPVPETMRFAATQHHPEPQWVFDAFDVEKGATRTFALKDVHFWKAG
jgi:hypothetical protein